MEEIIKGLWLGSDKDVAEAKRREYARLSCCKDSPTGDCHRGMLGYTSLGAPKGPEYLFARRGDWMTLNLIDSDDPDMIPDEVFDAGLDFLNQESRAGKKIFVHCNAGHSRSVGVVMLYLRAIGELPQGFPRAYHIFKTIYHDADMGRGMKFKVREHWNEMKNKFKEK